MQSVAGRKFDVERHRRADKVRTSRPRVPANIDVRPNNLAVRVHVIAVKAGAMVLIFADDAKPAGGRSISFPPAGNTRLGDAVLIPIKISRLRPQINDYRWPPGMSFRQIGRDHIGYGAAAAES